MQNEPAVILQMIIVAKIILDHDYESASTNTLFTPPHTLLLLLLLPPSASFLLGCQSSLLHTVSLQTNRTFLTLVSQSVAANQHSSRRKLYEFTSTHFLMVGLRRWYLTYFDTLILSILACSVLLE